MSSVSARGLALLQETVENGLLVIRVYQARDVIRSEQRRHRLAEDLRIAGYLRCRVRLGQRRNVQGDAWAEYVLTERGEGLVDRGQERPPQRAAWARLPFSFGAPRP